MLFADKVSETYKVINNLSQKDKLKLNIITKCYNSKSLEWDSKTKSLY